MAGGPARREASGPWPEVLWSPHSDMIGQGGDGGSPQADHPGGDRGPGAVPGHIGLAAEAGPRVIGCPGPQPRATFVPGDAANHARSPSAWTWSYSTSGWPATPCCGARPPCNFFTYYLDLGSRWWPCNASAAALAASSAAGGAGAVAADPACAPGAVFRRLPGSQAHARNAPGPCMRIPGTVARR
jgi:hypothetical protein